jgi:hypothetical protein
MACLRNMEGQGGWSREDREEGFRLCHVVLGVSGHSTPVGSWVCYMSLEPDEEVQG